MASTNMMKVEELQLALRFKAWLLNLLRLPSTNPKNGMMTKLASPMNLMELASTSTQQKISGKGSKTSTMKGGTGKKLTPKKIRVTQGYRKKDLTKERRSVEVSLPVPRCKEWGQTWRKRLAWKTRTQAKRNNRKSLKQKARRKAKCLKPWTRLSKGYIESKKWLPISSLGEFTPPRTGPRTSFQWAMLVRIKPPSRMNSLKDKARTRLKPQKWTKNKMPTTIFTLRKGTRMLLKSFKVRKRSQQIRKKVHLKKWILSPQRRNPKVKRIKSSALWMWRTKQWGKWREKKKRKKRKL